VLKRIWRERKEMKKEKTLRQRIMMMTLRRALLGLLGIVTISSVVTAEDPRRQPVMDPIPVAVGRITQPWADNEIILPAWAHNEPEYAPEFRETVRRDFDLTEPVTLRTLARLDVYEGRAATEIVGAPDMNPYYAEYGVRINRRLGHERDFLTTDEIERLEHNRRDFVRVMQDRHREEQARRNVDRGGNTNTGECNVA